ncbi:MAG: HNH endonuclease [Myxococcota bacterium]
MAWPRTHKYLLWAAATDATFRRKGEQIVGKCLHCRRKLALTVRGEPVSDATLEHIVPRNHGGTYAIENLAVACKRCNNGKGHRHDHKRADDPKLQAVIAILRERREERRREAPRDWSLPPYPGPAPN